MLKPSSCMNCSLYNLSDGFIESEGIGSNGVVILGEAGGYNEYLDGLPFRPYAQAGSMLEQAFKLAQQDLSQPVSRSQFLLYNVVNCRPPGDHLAGASYEANAIECCSKNVDNLFNTYHTPKTRTILALGNIPLKFLTGFSGVAEEKQSISHLRGFVFESKYGKVIPSFHPSYIRRGNGHLTPLLVEDIKKALRVASGLYTTYPSHTEYVAPRYQTTPGIDEAWSFYYRVKDSPQAILTYDIETPMTGSIDEDERDDLEQAEIVLVQFSLAKGEGIAMPYQGEYIKIIDAIFRLPNVKANHNTWNFDNPRIRAKGHVIEGVVHDTMWVFKHWHPRLPRGLQSVACGFDFAFPWKHQYSSNLNWYGCADVDAVQYIIRSLPKLMRARGVWDGYMRHVKGFYRVLNRATERGIPVSEEARLGVEKDFTERRKKVDAEIQAIIPIEIRNIKPARKDKATGQVSYGYIRQPPIVAKELGIYDSLVAKYEGTGRVFVSFSEFLWRKHNLTYGVIEDTNGTTGVVTQVERWAIVEPFKASSTQLIRYLKWKQAEIKKEVDKLKEERARKRNPELTAKIKQLEALAEDYEVPYNLKTKRETTSKKELEEMYFNTGDRLLELVVQVRSLDTNLNNYLPNWKPSPKDGCVHPTYGFTAPTGQINSWCPNSQNISKHTEFGNEFRGLIAAPQGYCYVEADKKSFHVATMGYCANDHGYIRFSQIDPHSILGTHIDPSIIGCSIDLKWSDADIKIAANEFKKKCKKMAEELHGIDVRQSLAKPTVLGNQLGLGPKKLQNQNRRFIHYVTEAERLAFRGKGYSGEGLQAIIANMFHKVEVFKSQIKEKAHLAKFLINEFARIQYFYDVFSFNYNKKQGKWDKRDGDGARHPVAFRVQSTAFGMITEEILQMEAEGMTEEHNFITTIHDSVVFMPEIGKKDKLIEGLVRIMNMPCKQLVNEATGPEGLRVGVDVSVGFNWKRFDKETNPGGLQEIKI